MTALSPEDDVPSPELAPRRLIDGGASDHERRLIASARLDRTPSSAKARVATALEGVLDLHGESAGPEGAARGDGRPPPRPRSGLAIVGAGIVGAGIIGTTALSLCLPATPAERSNAGLIRGAEPVLESNVALPEHGLAAPAPAASAPPPASAAVGAENPASASPAELSPPSDASKRKLPPRADRSRAERPRNSGAAGHDETESGLLAEVRALETVSSAIAAGRTVRATRELDAYRRRFARGELAIEADLLAIQIAVARGDDAAASAGAERLLARPEAEHYRARVRSMLDRENTARGRSNDAALHMKARR